jgi:hypothetical protein
MDSNLIYEGLVIYVVSLLRLAKLVTVVALLNWARAGATQTATLIRARVGAGLWSGEGAGADWGLRNNNGLPGC